MIKTLVTDGKGTLLLPNPPDGVRELVESLERMGISLAVATNDKTSADAVRKAFKAVDLPEPAAVATQKTVGARKPSGAFIDAIRADLGLEKHEVAYIGDDVRTDIFCAMNGGSLPLLAKYAPVVKLADGREYGIGIKSPKSLAKYLEMFGTHEGPYFGWDARAPSIKGEYRALVGDMRGRRSVFEDVLKRGKDHAIAGHPLSFKQLLYHYLINEVFLSGLSNEIDFVTVYPGHQAGSINKTLRSLSSLAGRLFRRRFVDDILVRHATAPKSQYQGADRNIFDQFRTIHVNPDRSSSIEGKAILVIDDFTTHGYSLETARQMLVQAGARRVVTIAMAKFRTKQTVTSIREEWDAYAPFPFDAGVIKRREISGSLRRSSDDHFWNKVYTVPE